MNYLSGVAVGLLMGLFIAVIFSGRKPLDATDNLVTGARSQMRILVDHSTGCQYLRSSSGGLTPRLDAQGKPMCTVEGQ